MQPAQRARSTPCCICKQRKQSARPISQRHRALLQDVPEGTVIRKVDSNPLFLPSTNVLQDEETFICFCKPCRLKSLEFSQRQTPSQDRGERKRSQGSALADYHARKKRNREEMKSRTAKQVLSDTLKGIVKCLEEDKSTLLWMKDQFEKYKDQCLKENVYAVSLRTFSRRVGALPSFALTTSHTERGHVISLQETSAKLVLDAAQRKEMALQNDVGHMLDSDRRLALQNLCTIYKGSCEQIPVDSNENTLIASLLSNIDAALFRNEMMDVEPESRKKRRAVVEKALNGDIESLPVPFGRALPLGEESLRQLKRPEFRCVVRVIATLQMKAFNMDSSCHGPLISAFGNALHLNGNRPLVSFANQMGMSPCYQKLEKEKKMLFDINIKKPNVDKVDSNTFKQLQWDNIDTCKTLNWLRVIGASIDYHGTILTAQVTKGLPALRGPICYKNLQNSEFPEPCDMLDSNRVYQKGHLMDAQTLFCGLIYYFKENLLSADKESSVSLEFLLKNSLEFKKPPEMTVTTSENIEIFSLPSNLEDTAKKIIDAVLEISRHNAEHADEASVCALTGDNPLYIRMISVIYKYFGGERAPEFSFTSPQLGLMHCSMAFFDAIKYLSFDSVLDALVKDSGFSKGSQDGFRKLKGFKSNLRFFQQATCAILIRMIDELIEEGLCDQNGMPLEHTNTVQPASCLSQKLDDLQSFYCSEEDEDTDFHLKVRKEFFPPGLRRIGSQIAKALNGKSSSIASPNGSFYAHVVMNMLIPCLSFHFFSRSGFLRERNSMLTTLIPYVYCTGKLKYQEALLFDLREKITMPSKVHEALFDMFGTCCNFTGNPQSWQHNDEGLESMAVKVIKEGATQGTESSIIASFHTINVRSRIVRKAMSAVVRPPGVQKGSSSFIRDSRIFSFDDRVKATASSVLRMYKRLCGNLPEAICKFPFYGVEHRAHPVLINPLSDDFLELSATETRKCLTMNTHGRYTMNQHGRILLYPWIDRNKKKLPWTRKHVLGGFAALRDKVKSNSKEAQQLREKTIRKEKIRKTLAQRALDLAHAQETGQKELVRNIKENIDLVSAMPHAFMNSGDDSPKHSSKSQTMPIFQDAAHFGTEQRESLFLIDGYPEIHEDKIVLAVDGMNYIHHGVDRTYAFTIRLHIEQVADRVLEAIPFSMRNRLLLLDIHFDDYSKVPLFKVGEQARRDEMRGLHSSFEELLPSKPLSNIDASPPQNWQGTVLANRTEKKAFVNIVAASVLISAGQRAWRKEGTTNWEFPVRIFGASFSISKSVLGVEINPDDLHLLVLSDGEPVVMLHRERDVPNLRNCLHKVSLSSCIRIENITSASSPSCAPSVQSTGIIRILEDSTGKSCVGEGEMRMQSQLSFASEKYPQRGISIAAVQVSSDSDNVALALMALHEGKYDRYKRVIVKLPSKFADINQLQRCLQSAHLCPLEFVRLYCLCGNDFCCGCTVATPSALSSTFLQYRELIGDLSDAQSTLKLYYLSFLKKRALVEQLFNMGIPFWSSKWKNEARKAIAYHPNTRSTDHLLPHDEDLELQHRRMTWNVSKYWNQCTRRNVQFCFDDNEEWGFQNNGEMLLRPKESLSLRRKILRSLKPASCGCGKATTLEKCCVPGKNNSCSCVKNGTACTYRCKCARVKCHFLSSAAVSQTPNNSAAKGHDGNRIIPITDLLNAEDSSESPPHNSDSDHVRILQEGSSEDCTDDEVQTSRSIEQSLSYSGSSSEHAFSTDN